MIMWMPFGRHPCSHKKIQQGGPVMAQGDQIQQPQTIEGGPPMVGDHPQRDSTRHTSILHWYSRKFQPIRTRIGEITTGWCSYVMYKD